MTIEEKTVHTSDTEVRIYKEGIFWIAYEQSAYIISQVKDLKPTKKYIKKIGKEIVSVGFPGSVLDKIASMFTLTERGDALAVMQADSPYDAVAYQQWKDRLETAAPSFRAAATATQQAEPPEKNDDPELSLSKRILAFDMGNSTPMQCFIFLNDLQRFVFLSELNGHYKK
ncbi:hypothetical protein FACS189426_21830 [Bacteroidia bacterium]|nr:hypothetical protein FACS189426_21830 [Bacteroidia bacterium]GHT84382.1 hypothetical protein FACS18947_1750 [Bacteroidia bacterium]